MKGKIGFPLSEQMKSNCEVHGVRWTAEKARKEGIPLWQATILILGKGSGLASPAPSRAWEEARECAARVIEKARKADPWLLYAHL